MRQRTNKNDIGIAVVVARAYMSSHAPFRGRIDASPGDGATNDIADADAGDGDTKDMADADAAA